MEQKSNMEFIDELHQTMKNLEGVVSDSWQYIHKIKDNADQGIRDLDPVYNLHMKIQEALGYESHIIGLTTSYMRGIDHRDEYD